MAGNVITAKSISLLEEEFFKHLEDHFRESLQEANIIIFAKGMRSYLEKKISEKFGVCFFIRFFYLEEALANELLPQETSLLSASVIRQKIFSYYSTLFLENRFHKGTPFYDFFPADEDLQKKGFFRRLLLLANQLSQFYSELVLHYPEAHLDNIDQFLKGSVKEEDLKKLASEIFNADFSLNMAEKTYTSLSSIKEANKEEKKRTYFIWLPTTLSKAHFHAIEVLMQQANLLVFMRRKIVPQSIPDEIIKSTLKNWQKQYFISEKFWKEKCNLFEQQDDVETAQTTLQKLQQFFLYDKLPKKLQKDDSIQLMEAFSVSSLAKFLEYEIRDLILQGKTKYDKIAIVSPEMEKLAPLLDSYLQGLPLNFISVPSAKAEVVRSGLLLLVKIVTQTATLQETIQFASNSFVRQYADFPVSLDEVLVSMAKQHHLEDIPSPYHTLPYSFKRVALNSFTGSSLTTEEIQALGFHVFPDGSFDSDTLNSYLQFHGIVTEAYNQLQKATSFDAAGEIIIHTVEKLFPDFSSDDELQAMLHPFFIFMRQLDFLDKEGVNYVWPQCASLMVEWTKNFLISSYFDSVENGIWISNPKAIRGLTFDYVFLLSMEEGIWPGSGYASSLYKNFASETYALEKTKNQSMFYDLLLAAQKGLY
ncbi:MAG: hypothetical protein D6767_08940, partial [Candidatus Hydrogenedentota bacterium]